MIEWCGISFGYSHCCTYARTMAAGARVITAVAPLLFHRGNFEPGALVVAYGKSILTQLTDAGTPLPHFAVSDAV